MRPIALFLAAIVLLPQPAFANAMSDARGVWMRSDGNARVRIAPCGQKLCATNLWIRDTSKGENVGDRLVMTLKPVSDSTLEGSAYDAKRKLTYSMTLTVAGKRLTTRGCVIGGLICKNVYWTPAK
jgi:uncharacterized protein (DUF2147 family)